MRVAGVDAYGQVLNEYTGHRRVDGDEPAQPWAVYLAGTDRRFRLLCFDLDAKSAGSAPAAARAVSATGSVTGFSAPSMPNSPPDGERLSEVRARS